MLVIGLGTPTALAREMLAHFSRPDSTIPPFTDANTYLAAGERLNVGHSLYRLVPGDREVLIHPGIYSAPLLSPPPIAAVWRPLAAWEGGFALWVVLAWVSLLGSVAFTILRAGVLGLAIVLGLAVPIGEQLAVANVTAFMPLVLIAVWMRWGSSATGAAIGAFVAFKIVSGAMVAFMLGGRDTRALAAVAASVVGLFLLGAALAGPNTYVEYLYVLQTSHASERSLSNITGIPLMSYAVLTIGSVAALATGRWRPLSFTLAITAMTFGTPALYLSSLVPLIAVALPVSEVVADWGGRDA